MQQETHDTISIKGAYTVRPFHPWPWNMKICWYFYNAREKFKSFLFLLNIYLNCVNFFDKCNFG